ncbi:MAG: putative Ig domain-containing protein [Rikenellaceae bacterium]
MKKTLPILLLSLAAISCNNVTTEIYTPEIGEGMYIVTPPAADKPNINGAEVFGVRPSHPFLYTIAATGVRPMQFAADNLPEGLSIDPKTGIISGTINSTEPKSYLVTLRASNAEGEATQPLEVIVGEEICLTPPLGWNSWNCWGPRVTQENVEASAKAMYDKGMVNYGWSYINIDDAWQSEVRGGEFYAIMPNPVTFPDMEGMCDRIHAMGMKVGIYSTPWVTSYAKHMGGSSYTKDGKWDSSMVDAPKTPSKDKKWQALGTYDFDTNDANQWAAWGIDYLKYDWNPNDEISTVRMAKALRNSGRDIVYSLSNTCPKDLVDVCREYVHCWRTEGDLKDRWDQAGSHKSICDIWPLHREWVNELYEGRAGHYADPDMLVVGYMDRGWNNEMTPSTLTADEQYSHIALWSLWSAPLLIGCPIERLDDFTLALLTNSEILDIQQDRNGIAGRSVVATESAEIIVKELYNGDKAIGLFNLTDQSATITLNWDMAQLEGKQAIRDAWRQKDIGVYKDSFSAVVPSHGNVLIVVSKK